MPPPRSASRAWRPRCCGTAPNCWPARRPTRSRRSPSWATGRLGEHQRPTDAEQAVAAFVDEIGPRQGGHAGADAGGRAVRRRPGPAVRRRRRRPRRPGGRCGADRRRRPRRGTGRGGPTTGAPRWWARARWPSAAAAQLAEAGATLADPRLDAPCEVLFVTGKAGVLDHTAAATVQARTVVPLGPVPVTARPWRCWAGPTVWSSLLLALAAPYSPRSTPTAAIRCNGCTPPSPIWPSTAPVCGWPRRRAPRRTWRAGRRRSRSAARRMTTVRHRPGRVRDAGQGARPRPDRAPTVATVYF